MTSTEVKDRLLTAREMGQQLGVKSATVLIWAANNVIPKITVNRKTVRFDAAEVRRHLAKRAT